MNPKIKVRMPKFTKVPQNKRYWAKELLLTILATSISIVLTFGTAYQIERREKANSQRQMAMMIIHDIDMSIKQMEKVDSIIREYSEMQLRILEGKFEDDIRIAHALLAMRDPAQVEFPETTERIFTSNVDTWSTIGKVDFIDNVSHCYVLLNQFKQKVIAPFHKKVHPDEMELKASSLDDYLDVEANYYLAQTGMAINQLKAANELNKKIMGITDKDLDSFVETKVGLVDEMRDSLDRVDSVIVTRYIEMDERKDVARENFDKNRDKMYPKKGAGGN
jgi:hypothetical protein